MKPFWIGKVFFLPLFNLGMTAGDLSCSCFVHLRLCFQKKSQHHINDNLKVTDVRLLKKKTLPLKS